MIMSDFQLIENENIAELAEEVPSTVPVPFTNFVKWMITATSEFKTRDCSCGDWIVWDTKRHGYNDIYEKFSQAPQLRILFETWLDEVDNAD